MNEEKPLLESITCHILLLRVVYSLVSLVYLRILRLHDRRHAVFGLVMSKQIAAELSRPLNTVGSCNAFGIHCIFGLFRGIRKLFWRSQGRRRCKHDRFGCQRALPPLKILLKTAVSRRLARRSHVPHELAPIRVAQVTATPLQHVILRVQNVQLWQTCRLIQPSANLKLLLLHLGPA